MMLEYKIIWDYKKTIQKCPETHVWTKDVHDFSQKLRNILSRNVPKTKFLKPKIFYIIEHFFFFFWHFSKNAITWNSHWLYMTLCTYFKHPQIVSDYKYNASYFWNKKRLQGISVYIKMYTTKNKKLNYKNEFLWSIPVFLKVSDNVLLWTLSGGQ